jgi:hypothetical protein
MASTITPTQARVNDPYQQTVFQYNTVDSKVYLSRESNKLLNVIGNDIVLAGMIMTAPTIVAPSTVRTTIPIGWAISDYTLIQFSSITTVDIDCSSLTDTDVDGSHLGVFLRYEYLDTIEPNTAAVDIFHIDSGGSVDNSSGRFSADSCRILLGVIDFTKSGTSVVVASIYSQSTLLVEGITMTIRGNVSSNINLANIFSVAFNEDKEYLLKRDFLLME